MSNRNYPYYPARQLTDLRQLVVDAAVRNRDKPLFTWFRDDGTLVTKTYREFRDDIDALGTAIAAETPPGSHIALLGANSYTWLVVFLAVVNGGNVVVPLDKSLPDSELSHVLSDSDATRLFYAASHADILTRIRPALPRIEQLVAMDRPEAGGDSVDQLLARGRARMADGDTTFTNAPLDNDKLAMLMYTSGTTGVAKGVMLSHRNVSASIVAACRTIWFPGDTVAVLPFHHVLGFFSVFLAIHTGLRVHLNLDLWDLARDLEHTRPAILALVPLFVERMHKKIWERAETEGRAGLLRALLGLSGLLRRVGIDLRRVLFRPVLKAFGGEIQVIFCGGAPLDPAYEKAMRDFGIVFVFGWGITECAPGVTSNRARWYRLRSVGHPFPGTEVRVLDPDENGEGELLVRGSHVMLGYYKNPVATAEALEDGWFHTGDCGRIDRDGFVFLTGRKKNVIILSNGKNVYPEEIEMALQTAVRGIAEVVVREADRRIVAEIYPDAEYVAREGILDAREHFTRHVQRANQTLADHKRIAAVMIRDTEFEKTTTKKIKRHAVVLP